MASPAYTELEVIMMNWLGRLLDLPEDFLNCSEGPGGGVIQVSHQICCLIAEFFKSWIFIKDTYLHIWIICQTIRLFTNVSSIYTHS